MNGVIQQAVAVGKVPMAAVDKGFGGLIDQAYNLAGVAVSDWRFWFAHLVTWAVVARLKWLWDHQPPFRRRRINEAVATAMCAGISVWVFYGVPNMWFYVVGNGLANTYLFKIAVHLIEKINPQWAKVFKSRNWSVQETSDGSGDLLVREDNEATLVLTPEMRERYRKGK